MKTEEQILGERARQLSYKTGTSKTMDETIDVVEFVLHPERYAIENKFICEVITLKDLTFIPGTPAYIMGVINYRGNILSIINLKILFGLTEKGLTEMNKVVIIRNEAMEFGIVTDSIRKNCTLVLSVLSSQPLTLSGIAAQFIKGIMPDGLILLDAGRMLHSKQLIVDQ